MEQMNNNKVYLYGEVIGERVFSHSYYNEKFYEYQLSVERNSKVPDVIPVLISERLESKVIEPGTKIAVKGQYRSHNRYVDSKSKLVLSVFVRELSYEEESGENPNQITLTGFVCKEPVYRTTPFKREICDVLLAVNRAYNKSDYIPCIAWGRNANFVKNFKIGQKMTIEGRIQSRKYQKKKSETEFETKMAYEISISKIATEDNNAVTEEVTTAETNTDTEPKE